MSNITSKELSAISDQLTQEKLLIDKINMYSSNTNDGALKCELDKLAQKHKCHYDSLLNLLG